MSYFEQGKVLSMRRTIAIAAVVLGCAAWLPSTASADLREWVNYSRNGTLTNGRITYNCEISTCAASWRGGSGSGTNACQTNNWIPVGTYDVPFHDDSFAGSKIQGRVWRMSDYHCSNGVVRTELFIHTEETSSRGQYCPTAGDDPFCWEGTNDYYSQGCIKISRSPGSADMGALDNWEHGDPGRLNWISVYS